jgi:4-alpha-glucanotransferase
VWSDWPEAIRRRDLAALARQHVASLQDDVLRVKFVQWQFFRQWHALKELANGLGIRVIGDIPIFVAYDSADVWAHPELFDLDAAGKPATMAGVPPDYFSRTGQLWGNPLYRWDVLAGRDFDWWIERVRAALQTVDIVRIDHFRGFEAYWEVPASAPTAETGRWVKGPGRALFEAMKEALTPDPSPSGGEGSLPIIAEDLGFITPEVRALREAFDLPGMKIIQFAFSSDADDPFLPHNYPRDCVVYTGTHDNDTAVGWFQTAGAEERRAALTYLGTDGSDFAWDLIRLGSMSVAETFIAPAQDLLSLGGEARMNFPSKPSGNWQWRLEAGALTPEVAERLRVITEAYGRTRVLPPTVESAHV